MRFPRIILLVLAVILVLIILSASPKSADSRDSVLTVKGPINVTINRKNAMSTNTPAVRERVASIQIRRDFVLIYDSKNKGEYIPTSEIINLTWGK